MADISVIIPVYNSEATIADCVESVLRQTFNDLEVIVVDDGSKDDSGKICDDIAAKDSRVTVVHQSNKGRTEARAVGTTKACGKWICYVDSDDTLPADALALLFSKVGDDVDIVFGNGYTLTNEHREKIPIAEFRHLAVRAEGSIGVPWGSLYRREVLMRKYDESRPWPWVFDVPRHIVNGEDYLFWLRLVFSTERPVAVVRESVYHKGEEHTSNSFKWTADYCYKLNELRKASIPEDKHDEFLSDMLTDRLENMFSVAQWSKRSEWQDSQYYKDILQDMQSLGMKMPLKSRLFLALPFLWLRRLYSWVSENRGYSLFLSVVFLMLLLLNLLDAPTLSDDMIYRFKWHADELEPVETINGLGDLLQSQWTHYLVTNGRFVVHLLAQGALVFVPPVVIQVINCVLFVVMIHLVVCLAAGKTRLHGQTQQAAGKTRLHRQPSQRLFVGVMAFALLFLVFQGIRTTMLWSLGAFNYLWVVVANMCLLLYLRRIADRPLTWCYVFLSVFALPVGWSHEALSLPLSVTFFALLLIKRRLWHSAVWPFLLFYILGCALCMVTPALWSRAADAVSLQARLISGAINCVSNVRITWLLVITIIILWWKHRSVLPPPSSFLLPPSSFLTLAVALGIVLLCGTNLERVAFFVDFIAMILLLSLLQNILSDVWKKRLIIISGVLILLCFVPAYMVRKQNYDSWQMAEQQMKEPGRELIVVSLPMRGQNMLMDYFCNHYVNPSFDFGFYCSYMGFDATDINMRCAARLYGKDKMYFLPEDVVRKAETDSTAYTNYELDDNGLLFVWQLPRTSHLAPRTSNTIDSLIFVLNDEDPATLNPLQRLVAYKDSTFVLDDYNYEVVDIAHRPYLVFTKPTTNIFRRINHIEYHIKH